MLQKFNQFSENILLENLVNESVIYFSPDFRRMLSTIDNDIATDLLEIEVTDIKPDMTFVDLDSDKDDYLSFTTMKNALKTIEDGYGHLKEIENEPSNSTMWSDKDSRISLINQMYRHSKLSDVFNKSRNPIRIGKFVNKVIPNKYNPKQVEEFVNILKSRKEQSGERFEIVEGKDIGFWYKSENYAEIKGQLGNSCMREKPANYFEIYIENPEVCRMLILLEGDKLIGRALVWKLSQIISYGKEFPKDLYFMDRQYTIKESDVDKFRSYADENEWVYKTNNNHHSFDYVTYKGASFRASLRVDIESAPEKYPYMDTFRRFNPVSNELFNDDEDSSDYEGDYILDSTDGEYREVESGVWSEWHDRMIPENDAVWSDWAQSYLDENNSVLIDSGSRRNHGWYPDGCDFIVHDEWNDTTLHIEDTVWSDVYGYSLDSSTAVEVINDIDSSDGEPMGADSNWYHEDDTDILYLSNEITNMSWYSRLSDKFSDWENYNYTLKELFIKNYEDKWIPSLYKIIVYKVKGSLGIEYLSKLDAEILEINIESGDGVIMDKFEYFEMIEGLLPRLFRLLSREIKKLEDELSGSGQIRLKFNDDIDKNYQKSLRNKISRIKTRIDDIEDGLFIDFED
jgi:hypothetical protein